MIGNNSYSPDTSVDVILSIEQFKHEQNQLKEEHDYDLSKQEKDNAHVREIEKAKLGKVGQLFGAGDNASKNITATICILLIIGAAAVSLYAYIVKDDKELAGTIWGGDCSNPHVIARVYLWKEIIMRIIQDERWSIRYNEVMEFIASNHRNPSKYAPEERLMIHFLKRGRKLINAGELKEERVEKFRELLALCEQYKRENQYE